jgi:hypothetical protein
MRVVPQRCRCGPLPTQTDSNTHTCACGNDYELIPWGGLKAWFSVEPTQVGIQTLKDLLVQHPRGNDTWSWKWTIVGLVVGLLIWLAVGIWVAT